MNAPIWFSSVLLLTRLYIALQEAYFPIFCYTKSGSATRNLFNAAITMNV